MLFFCNKKSHSFWIEEKRFRFPISEQSFELGEGRRLQKVCCKSESEEQKRKWGLHEDEKKKLDTLLMICFPRCELLLRLLEIVKSQYVLAHKLYSKQDWFLYETNWRRLFPHDKLSFEVLMCFCWRLDLHLLFWKSVAAHGGRQLSCSFAYLQFRLFAVSLTCFSSQAHINRTDWGENMPIQRFAHWTV